MHFADADPKWKKAKKKKTKYSIMFKSGKTLVYYAVITEMRFYIFNYSSIYYHLLAGHIKNVIAIILLTTARVAF